MSLQVKDLTKAFSVRTLFSGVTFSVNPGERIALVGVNGSGKTTLMKILLGREHADHGQVILPRDAVVGYLPQEIFLEEELEFQRTKGAPKGTSESSASPIPGVALPLWDLVSQAFSKLRQVEKDLADTEAAMGREEYSQAVHDRHERLLETFQQLGGYNWQARMIRAMKGLGFPEERFHEPITNFSGGWRMRAYFARLLLSSPDFLLLDEPTNYLDIASINFIEEYLSTYPGGILIVSHDRYFLDNLATSVVALMPEGARVYRGNYSDFLIAREQWTQEAEAARGRHEREVKRITDFVDRFRYKASKASQVQSRIKMLSKMSAIELPRESKKIHFGFPECQSSGDIVIAAENISRSFGSLEVLQKISFNVHRQDRLAIIGENGTGKTTLMKILSGQDRHFSGTTKTGFRVMQAYFAQDEEISFEKDETVFERLSREAPMDQVSNLRSLLGAFLFSGDMVKQMVRVLSGGEKSRLGLARILLRPCNLLFLDEPTNHLDISSREALLSALEEFPGTLIFVSHDRYFLNSLATRVIALDGGKATLYEGDYSQYLWMRKARAEEAPAAVAKSEDSPPEKSEARGDWKNRKRQSNQRQRQERELAQAEAEITDLEAQFSQLESELANPTPDLSREALAALALNHADIQARIDAAMSRWENLQRLLEE